MKIEFEEENLHRFHVRALPRLCVRFRWMLKSGLQIWAGKCDVQFTCWPLFEKKKHYVVYMHLKTPFGEKWQKNKFILAGHSLSGNRAMRSFLEAIWKHSENLPPKTSPNHLCALQVGATDTKLLDSADMSWFGLLHIISEELATTFMETDENELRCPNCILNEAQTVTPAVQPQKVKHSHSAATIKL